MPELGNLTACIFLPPSGLSTVKIRTGSLFCTIVPRIGAWDADFHPPTLPFQAGSTVWTCFPPPSTAPALASQDVHRRHRFKTCATPVPGSKV